MKKLTLPIILSLCLLGILNGCFRSPSGNGENDPSETVLTSPYGDPIPTYEDVNYTATDPALFKTDVNGRVYYDSPNVKTFTGIDVSVFQGEIDWTAVKNDGVDFVILRVGYRGYGSEGKLGVDDKFVENYEGATSAGLDVGVYFFSQAVTPEEAREEARFTLEQIRGKNVCYPVAYDWEHIDYDTARTDDLSNETISACAAAFCDEIAAAGYQPLIYFNRELGYFSFDLSVVKDYHFWVAEYVSAPSFVYDYKIWQYSKSGTVAGIDGGVDMNICLYDFAHA